jgi:membrane peptidoglycan carboxypeptidase
MRYKGGMRTLIRAVFLTLLLGIAGSLWWAWENRDRWIHRALPYDIPTETLEFSQLRGSSSRVLLDHKGEVLDVVSASPFRFYRPLSQIHSDLQELVVFMEDAKFFFHDGFDKEEILNSVEKNFREGKVRRGGSTLTQQLAKNLFLSKDRTWTRKAFEVPWTLRLERDLTKKQILELYLNTIEWGPQIRGAEAAARFYFDKSAADLTLGESMALALIVPNPIAMNLHRQERAKESLRLRRQTLLGRLRNEKRLNDSEMQVYEATDWQAVSLQNTQRHFPFLAFSQQGSAAALQTLFRSLSSHVTAQQRTSLDKKLVHQIHDIPLIQYPASQSRWVLWRQGQDSGPIRAARQLKKGLGLQPGQTPDGYVAQEVSTLPFKSLVE